MTERKSVESVKYWNHFFDIEELETYERSRHFKELKELTNFARVSPALSEFNLFPLQATDQM